jgi:hypothetical protein
VIVTAVVSPHPPVLLRELCGAEDTVPELRAACGAAVGAALRQGPDTVVVVGGAATTQEWDPDLPIGLRRFGTTHAPDDRALPQALGVARRLLDEAGWAGPTRMCSVARDADPATVAQLAREVAGTEGRVVLLVMADGSARRGEKAPGHLDERAFAVDEEIGRALADGDPEPLAKLDPDLCADLLVKGRAALAVLAEVAAGGRPAARVTYRDDPYGVMYTVAAWDLAGTAVSGGGG